MPLLGRPSRSYKNVEHNAEGLSGIGSAPYASSRHWENGTSDHTVKTYKPSYAELHFNRKVMHDPHPGSSFSPLPPAFQLGRKNKEQALAGQRAELDHILEPGYRTASIYGGDDDNASTAGPSRLSSVRTAGGLSALSRRSKEDNLLRPTRSTNAFASKGGEGGGLLGRKGVYLDSTGRIHDQEYDPFAGVSEISRRKSRRRSAFGGQRRGSYSSNSASGSSSDSELMTQPRSSFETRTTTEDERERDEIRRRTEVERRRLDEVSGYAAARRKSIISDRASVMSMRAGGGTATPSIRSGNEDGFSIYTTNGSIRPHSRLSQRQQHAPSPLTPTVEGEDHDDDEDDEDGDDFQDADEDEVPEEHVPRPPAISPAVARHRRAPSSLSASSLNTGHVSMRATSSAGGNDESPRKHTERERVPIERQPPPPYRRIVSASTQPIAADHRTVGPDILVPKDIHKPLPEARRNETITTIRRGQAPMSPPQMQRIERAPSGATRITGFDAGPPRTPAASSPLPLPESVKSGASSRSSEKPATRPSRSKPVERPREQLFPETPAQAKKREEKERRNMRSGKHLGVDATVTAASTRTRILPEIEIVEDDDPRIIFPTNGRATQVQKHEHVIRSHYGDRRLDTSGPTGFVSRSKEPLWPSTSERDATRTVAGTDLGSGSLRDPSNRSISYGDSLTKPPSTIIEQSGGGYLPSRWAGGDRDLRVTDEQKERYRPTEWGGRHGDLGGRLEDWRPDTKDVLKRNIKDMSTNARFSMFRAKKKILRKAEL